MRVIEGIGHRKAAFVDIFKAAFTASEGAGEGEVIAALVDDILSTTAPEILRVFGADENGDLVGAVAFTRLHYPEDDQQVMLLSPMAVAPSRWRQGVGRKLISAALSSLGNLGVDVCITYGDPKYYSQVGFHEITEADAATPLPLSMPQGWLGQRLADNAKPRLKGPSECVAAFQKADLW